MNKHKAVWDWVSTCPQIHDMFFNFGENRNEGTILEPITAYKDYTAKDFIDDRKLKYYDFAIIQFKAVSTIPNSEENINILLDIESIAHWIDEQGKNKNYPKFPSNCNILELYTIPTNTGYVAGVDEDSVKYMLQFRIEYLYCDNV